MSRRIAFLPAALLLLLLCPVRGRADPIHNARYPHVRGDLIAFSYMGDIWLARRDGSNPRRLTVHVGRDVNPRFSPDGQWIAFSSNRWGNNDVFVVPVTGGEPRQLTWHTANDDVQYWTPDGQGVVFSTSRGPNPWGAPLYVVSLAGGLPLPLDMDVASAGMIKQDGSLVAFNRKPFSYWRKGYRGNRSTDIFVQDTRSKEIHQLTDTDIEQYRTFTQDALPMWGVDGMIYFLSERDGTFNIWKISPSGGSPTQVTHHEDDGVQFPSISPDGRTIIYEEDFDLWTLDVPAGQPHRIALDLAFDPKQNLVDYITTRNQADGFSVAPAGDLLAVDFHGEIFTVPTDPERGEKRGVTHSAWRQRDEVYAADGKKIAYISDETKEEQIWVYDVATGDRRQLTTMPSYKSTPAWSPGSDRLAFVVANRLYQAELASGRVAELAHNPASGYQNIGYAPDGKWLVYTRSDDDLNSDVYLFDIGARQEYDVSANPFRDRDGTVSPDGRTLVFISNRAGGTDQLFAVSLTRLTEDPDDPLVRARQAPRRDSGGGPGGRGGRGGAAPAAAAPLQVDTAGIGRRAIQLTTGSNPVSGYFLSRDGATVYFNSRDDDGPALFSVSIRGQGRRKVTAGSFPGLTPTADRREVFYRQAAGGGGRGGRGGRFGGPAEIWKLTLANQRKARVAFSFPVEVDHRAEWEQLFEESWRVMKYRFYDEKMHGVDWDAVRERYRPLLQYIGSNEDVYDLANQMIGELNASHTGVSGPPSHQMDRPFFTRQPGFELEPANGRYRISHIYHDGPADKEWLNLHVGDYVLAIDGVELKAGDNYWKVLDQALNEYVPVRVARNADGAGSRAVRIRTVQSVNNLKYEEWVAKNREWVDQASHGDVAYVHIRAMNQPSLERFQNEIDQFWNKKGIIIDIRYNGGGNIDQQLLDILERRPYEYWNNRWASRTAGRRPRQAIAGPKVMLINWRSASDSEVTPLGFRQLGLGRIVGNPTSAMVIATGSYRLINGGSIRTPGSLVVTYDPTRPDNFGINLENYGVAPDVFAVNTPEDELQGFDRELKAALDEVLRMLQEGK